MEQFDKCNTCCKNRNKIQSIRVPSKIRKTIESAVLVDYWLYCNKCKQYSAMGYSESDIFDENLLNLSDLFSKIEDNLLNLFDLFSKIEDYEKG